MAATLTTPKTLLAALQPAGTASTRLAWMVGTVVVGTLLIAVASKINVPTWPVPVTLQTMAVAFLAAAFGWRIGVATVVLYIAEGLAGLPVFAGDAAGPLYALTPAFGFILGFIPMAAIIGWAADAGYSRNFGRLFAAMLLGDVVCFAIGYAWLTVFLVDVKGVGFDAAASMAFQGGVQPFALWDVVKMAFAAISAAGCWGLVRKEK